MLKKDLLVTSQCQGHKSQKFDRTTAKALITVFLILAVFLFALPALAVNLNVGIQYGAGTGLSTQDIRITIARIIQAFLGLLGIIAVSLILYAGWIWMTSQGNPEKIDQAKKILINAVIGLIIILSAFAIASFILNSLLDATGARGRAGGPNYGDGGGALGAGIIQTHYPPRNAFNIPRNTKIIVTFKQKMTPSSIIKANDIVDTDSVKIAKKSDPNNFLTDVTVRVSSDQKTFVFYPATILGSSDEPTMYKVTLTNNIKKYDGTNAFGNYGGYDWSFEVSTLIDVTPPQIVKVLPASATTVPKNTVIRVDFNEPINPLTLGGVVEVSGGTTGSLVAGTFNYINVFYDDAGTNKYVGGEFLYSNEYKTVEFVSNNKCGTNSCGEDIFCLPGLKNLNTLVKAASLGENSKIAKFPYDGVVDMSDNSLDGNKNTGSDGQPADNYQWNFNTSDQIDLEPPLVIEIFPSLGQVGVVPNAQFQVKFDKPLMSDTLKPDSGYGNGKKYFGLIQPSPAELAAKGYPSGGWGYTIANELIASNTQTLVTVLHEILGDNLPFSIEIGSGVRSSTQNCYLPCADDENCIRQAGSLPGQYEQGSPWMPASGAFPSCNLGGAAYQSFGNFNLSYSDNAVNKVFNFGAFGLLSTDSSINDFYSFSGGNSDVEKYGGVFSQMLAPNRLVSLIYFDTASNEYYLVNFYGKSQTGVGGTSNMELKGSGHAFSFVVEDDTSDIYTTNTTDNVLTSSHNWVNNTMDGEAILIANRDQDVSLELKVNSFTLADAEWYLYSPQGFKKLEIPGTVTINLTK